MGNDKQNWGGYTILEKADRAATSRGGSTAAKGANSGPQLRFWSFMLILCALLVYGGVSCMKYFVDAAMEEQKRQFEAAKNRPKLITLPLGFTTLTLGQQWSDQYSRQAQYLFFRQATGPFVATDGRNQVTYEPVPGGGVRQIDGASLSSRMMQFRCLSCGTSNITLTLEATNERR
jgi:type II secretory pathway pseudopilin PulG